MRSKSSQMASVMNDLKQMQNDSTSMGDEETGYDYFRKSVSSQLKKHHR